MVTLSLLCLRHLPPTGLRATLLIGNAVTALGALLRYLSTLMVTRADPRHAYLVLFVGSAVTAVAQNLVLGIAAQFAGVSGITFTAVRIACAATCLRLLLCASTRRQPVVLWLQAWFAAGQRDVAISICTSRALTAAAGNRLGHQTFITDLHVDLARAGSVLMVVGNIAGVSLPPLLVYRDGSGAVHGMEACMLGQVGGDPLARAHTHYQLMNRGV